jgi:subtilisin family serine protease
MKISAVSLAVLVALGSLSGAAMAQSRSTYIVQLAAEPKASYNGTIAGLAATQPTAGQRFNGRSAAAVAYGAYLDTVHANVAATVAGAPIIARYSTVYSGFAARLTNAEVQTLRANPNVVAVHPDTARKLETISTSAFLGLSSPGGLWSQNIGGSLVKGEDIIIGVVDGGIWPESPSYADRVDGNGVPVFSGGTQAYGPAPAGWAGICQAGEGFSAANCNNKLIGARYFNAGFVANNGANKHWTEFYSPRDSVGGAAGHGGHGSHTSSTAGGNSNAPVTLAGIALGGASGMAPRARIAAYKVCYTFVSPSAPDGTGSENTCYTSDSVSAIDRAVADGVHVINYSISGDQTSVNDPVEQAFLRAAKAGVFVAASAGNSGPAQAVAHVSPWLTTVAASTHSRAFSADAALGNAAKYTGASLNTTAVNNKAVVVAEDNALPGATNASLCFSNPASLDPAKVAGKIVVCTRGGNARIDKSLAVLNAGGIGMIMADNGSGLVAEVHSVPSVHVSVADGTAIKAYARAGGTPTASVSTYYQAVAPAPIMAGFSSRGPNAGDANMLKPDLTAPGVDVIATVTPDLTQAQHDAIISNTFTPPAAWASYQGTSMSSPHVAGLAALIKQAHPTWSPQAIKSALMTTTVTTLDDGVAGQSNGLLPWSQGAGHVVPNRAIDPGLVYDNGPNDFTTYQCKVNKAAVSPQSDCTTLGTLDETYNYNLPSITVGSVPGSVPVVVRRKVTNVGTSTANYSATVAAPPGFTAVPSPASFSIAVGETKSYTLTITRTTAAFDTWSYGRLSLSDGTHTVAIPVTARASQLIPLEAPTVVNANTASGSRLFTLKTGFSGRMSANKGGMKADTVGPATALTPQPQGSAALKAACQAGVDTASIKVYPVSIPAGGIVARFELHQSDSGANNDHDMMLLAPDNTTAVYSGNDGTDEAVQMVSPVAGNYKVCVLAWGGTAMTHKLHSWVVTSADASGTLNVLLPGNVVAGGTATAGITWSGLANGGHYIGGVQYKDPTGAVVGATVVNIAPGGAVPTAAPERSVATPQLRK